MKEDKNSMGYRTSRSERLSYWSYFFGQNVFYGLIAINMQTFFSDVGITAIAIAAIMFATRLWDAVNDILLGIIIDKTHFKKGRFLPWLRIAMPAMTISGMIFFLLPIGGGPLMKIIWATLTYVAWSMSYTISDVPMFVLPTSMTDNIKERGQMLTMGRFFAMIGIVGSGIALPILQARFGWQFVGFTFSIFAMIFMIPLLFKGKERRIIRPEKTISFKQMYRYVAGNKYLLIFYLALLISGLSYFTQYIQIYFARHCLGNQEAASLISLISMLPLLLIGGFLPAITKRFDKYKVYILSNIMAATFGFILYIVGYSNLGLFYVLFFIQSIFLGANNILLFTFTPDCLEYGTYHTGERAEGVAASVQTFTSKLIGSIGGPIAMIILSFFGFVSGENAVQPESVTQEIWMLYTLLPACGIVIAIFVLRFYKLRDKDVQVMAQYNNAEISKEEAEALLKDRYGEAAQLVKMSVKQG